MSLRDLRQYASKSSRCSTPDCGRVAHQQNRCGACRARWMRYGHYEPGRTMPWFPHMFSQYAWATGDYRRDPEAWLLAGARVAQAWVGWIDANRRRSKAAAFLHRRWPWTLGGRGKGSALWLARMVATPHLYRLSLDRDDDLHPMTARTAALAFNSCLMEGWTGSGRRRMSARRRAWRTLREQAGIGRTLLDATASHLEVVGERYLEWQRAGGVLSEAMQARQDQLLDWLDTAGERCIEANRKIARRRQAGLPVHLPGRAR